MQTIKLNDVLKRVEDGKATGIAFKSPDEAMEILGFFHSHGCKWGSGEEVEFPVDRRIEFCNSLWLEESRLNSHHYVIKRAKDSNLDFEDYKDLFELEDSFNVGLKNTPDFLSLIGG